MYQKYFKRLVDILASASCILIFSPLMIITGLMVYFEDRGNPVFKQKRVGMHKKPFTLMKFRSMPIQTKNVASTEVSKLKITKIGKFIRRTNLDELPQLINILKGDMSLIGPRPSLISQAELIELRAKYNVYQAKPGLTGLAQVNAFDNMPDAKKASWDGEYANNISFINDIKIVLRTFVYLTKKPPTY